MPHYFNFIFHTIIIVSGAEKDNDARSEKGVKEDLPADEEMEEDAITTQKANKYMLVCKFFQTKNGCWNGAKCEYIHVAKETIYKGRICKFYLGGTCNKGDKCSFRHPTDVRTLTEKKDGSNYKRRDAEETPERNMAHSRILQQNREAKKATERWISPKQEDSKWGDDDDVNEEDLPDERWEEYPELRWTNTITKKKKKRKKKKKK